MAGPNLRTDNDARFTDSTTAPDVKEHQQVHDTIGRLLNLLGVVDVTFQDGQVLAWDSAAGMFVPTAIGDSGSNPVATSYVTAAAGSVFRLVWSGSWPASRPSDRPDIYFDLAGAPSGVGVPTWLRPGDNSGQVSVYTADQAHAIAVQALNNSESVLGAVGIATAAAADAQAAQSEATQAVADVQAIEARVDLFLDQQGTGAGEGGGLNIDDLNAYLGGNAQGILGKLIGFRVRNSGGVWEARPPTGVVYAFDENPPGPTAAEGATGRDTYIKVG